MPDGLPGRYVLVLHGHIPDVLGHGVWPHGEDWLYEAAAESYLPVLEALDRLFARAIPVRVTIGITPVLASQLEDPRFVAGFRAYLAHRVLAAADDEATFEASGDAARRRLATGWRVRFAELQQFFDGRCRGSIVGAYREAVERGQVEIMSSSATHGYFPLLPSEASVRAQVALGVATTTRLFGRAPKSYWIPECAYRPAGLWSPPWHGRSFFRPGLESHLAAAGIAATVVDAHLVGAERTPDAYGEPGLGPWRDGRTPLRPWRIEGSPLSVLAREPETSLFVWSAQRGYPGDPAYLEFHKRREPGGHRYWRVTDPKAGLESKRLYEPESVPARIAENALHFVSMVRRRLLEEADALDGRGTLMTPFDLELFGHWWSEGTLWLEEIFTRFAAEGVATAFASEAAASWPDAPSIALPEGSWGEGGDHRVWWNEATRGYWEWVVRAEKEVRELARDGGDRVRPALARAIVRQLLLLEASDWPFSIRNGTSTDYAEARVEQHAGDLSRLVALARRELAGGRGSRREEHFLRLVTARDRLFDDDDLPSLANWAEARRAPIEVPGPPPRVALIAAECAPLAKVGGLADVVGALPRALEKVGVEVRVVLPLYRDLDRARWGIDGVVAEPLRTSDSGEPFSVRRCRVDGVGDVDLVDLPRAFDRPGLYGGGDDEFGRWLDFSRAALDALHAGRFRPDVLHLHDQQTAVVTELIRSTGRGEALGHPATVFTIHNMGHPGEFALSDWSRGGLPWEAVLPKAPFEFHGSVNLLKGAITLADRITTVSERYALEIATIPRLGGGLGHLLRARGGALAGILNGIDEGVWNPALDPTIAARYSLDEPSGRAVCRADLLARTALPDPGPGAPVFGLVSRLVVQKGIDRLVAILPRLLREPGSFVVLGSGEPSLEEALRQLARQFPARLAFVGGAREELAHAIFAGADFILVPSRWEPCGLTQMYALRYGAVPIVRETGGLADTVSDVDRHPADGNGISYRVDSPAGLYRAIVRARRLFADRDRYGAVRRRGMASDFSWDRAARRYLSIFREAVEAARWD